MSVGLGVTYLAKKHSPNKDDVKLEEIRGIFSSLPIPPGFEERGSSFQSKAENALVTKYFHAGNSYDSVKAFYDQYARDNGWLVGKERSVTDWGRDFGGRQLEFRKGYHSLIISYSGEKSNEDQNYAISVVWN